MTQVYMKDLFVQFSNKGTRRRLERWRFDEVIEFLRKAWGSVPVGARWEETTRHNQDHPIRIAREKI